MIIYLSRDLGRFDFSDIVFSSRCLFSIVFRLDQAGAGYLSLTEKCTNHHALRGTIADEIAKLRESLEKV